MRQKTIKLFSITELAPEAKEKVIEKYRHINVDDEYWNESILGDWKTKLEALGYEDVKIMYSGFGSQGDGACFTASVDIAKWLRAHKLSKKHNALYRDNGEHFSYDITHSWRYYFATSTNVEQGFWDGSTREAQTQAEAVLTMIQDEREMLGNKIYRKLQDEYFAQIEDDAVEECIEANDYEFLEDGTRFRD